MSKGTQVGGIVLERCTTCNRLALSGETITIPMAEYETLKTTAAAEIRRRNFSLYRAVSNSRIARNPPLAEFIVEAAATMTVSEVLAACREKFGDGVTSWASIYRFLTAMRGDRR